MTIQIHNAAHQFKSELNGILAPLFAGSVTATVGGTELEFPQAKVVFDSRSLKFAIDSPIIAITGSGVTSLTTIKSCNPGDLTRHGREDRVGIKRQIIITCPLSPGNIAIGNDPPGKVVNTIWGLLRAKLTEHSTFSNVGIMRPMMSVIPDEEGETTDFAFCQGWFECELNIKYAAYNL